MRLKQSQKKMLRAGNRWYIERLQKGEIELLIEEEF